MYPFHPSVRTTVSGSTPPLDGILQAACGGVRNSTKPNPPDSSPIQLGHNHHQRLPCRSAAALAGLFASNIRFIDFHNAGQSFSAWPDHSAPEFVQPRPCRFVTPKPQNLLQSKSAGPRLLTCDPPDGAKPHPQRLARAVKDRSSCDRSLVGTCLALDSSAPQSPALGMPTARANKTIRPAQLKEIVQARLFRREVLLQISKRSGVCFHTLYILHIAPT